MTIEIKKSWFEANWNKPNRMKRHMKRYYKKSTNIALITSNAYKYNLTMPKEYSTLVENKYSFYDTQRKILQSMINVCFSREINEENKSKIIDDIFKGKRYYAIYTDEKGIRYHSSFPPYSFFKKKRNN